MLSREKQKEIENIVQPLMEEYFMDGEAIELLKKKESGHVMGTIIEEKAEQYLKDNNYRIEKEVNKLGETLARAHSDFNLIELEESHRINVKFSGEKNGQPNICSIRRIMDSMLNGAIDSYYLLKVKYDRNTKKTEVFFVDIFDYLESCIHYDGGTGQTMLKEKKFYEMYGENGYTSSLSMNDKMALIYDIYTNQMEKHIQLKNKQLKEYKEKFNVYFKNINYKPNNIFKFCTEE